MRAEIEWNEKLLIDLEWPYGRERGAAFACSMPSSTGPGEADLPPSYDEVLNMTLLSLRSRTRPVYYHLGGPVLPVDGREHEEQVYFPDVPPPEPLRPPSSVVGQTTTTPAPISGLRQLILLIITLFVTECWMVL